MQPRTVMRGLSVLGSVALIFKRHWKTSYLYSSAGHSVFLSGLGWAVYHILPPSHLIPLSTAHCTKCSVGLHNTPTPAFLQHQVDPISSDQSHCTHLAALTLLLSHHKGLMNIFCLQLFLSCSQEQVWAEWVPWQGMHSLRGTAKAPSLQDKSQSRLFKFLLKYCFFRIIGPIFLSLI